MTGLHRMRGIALAAFALGACAPAMVNRTSEEQAIRDVGADWQRAIAARDVDRIVAIHAPDAVVMPSNMAAASGASAIRAAYTGLVGMPGLSLSWVPTTIDVASPTVATEVGTYTMSFNGPQGPVTDRGNYTTVWHKINGQWRVASDATVSATPFPTAGADAAPMDMSDTKIISASSLAWSDFRPAVFDPGMKLAVLAGDPAAKGVYTLRLLFPAGYRFPVHWHPGAEQLTVVSGSFVLGMGNTADWGALKTYSPGDFLYIPARHAHFGGGNGTTVIQLHGMGPFQLVLGAPQ
ncbi:MAG: SgcJ/EcaC family oxidoreductase [Gemmatimonadaceae bacterium]